MASRRLSENWAAIDWSAMGVAAHRHYSEVTSTNDVARELACTLPGDSFPLLVTCDQQTNGRGRHGRQWSHSAGSLACSIVVQLPTPDNQHSFNLSNDQQRLAIWTAVCLQETATHYLPNQRCQIKWPNDMMIADRKNAGILIEPVPGQPRLAVVGIGININNLLDPSPALAPLDRFSWAETQQRFAVPEVLANFLNRWFLPAEAWPPPMSNLHLRFQAVDWLRGKRLEVQAMGAWNVTSNGELCVATSSPQVELPQRFTGFYAGITSHGFLRLIDQDGTELVFPSVERVHTLS
jgi:biotin-[acetyl-CoA-carboxylase] ligase BirA-like protein